MRKIILTFVLCTLSICPLFSQEAFYIYRNDGDFNGFFYDEVVEMRYSKFDFDSVEHNNYIMYEVQLADTLYRIPLAAIDSIGFQQPEIILNPQLRHMDLLEMTPYITAVDGQILTFSNELPDSIMPQVGNVLFGMTGIFEETNFAGRVTSVTPSGDGIIVQTDELTSISDIFLQFITIEEVGIPDEDPQQVVYRMAGNNKIKQADGAWTINMVNVNLNFHLPISDGGLVSGSFDGSISLKHKMSVIYQINDEIFFVKCLSLLSWGLQSGFTIKISGSDESITPIIPKPFSTWKWPVTPPIPLFECTPVPSIGFRYGGELTTKVTFPPVGGTFTHGFTIDAADPYVLSITKKYDPIPTSPDGNIIDNSDLDFKLEGMIQFGMKEELALKTNQVFRKIISMQSGMDIWAGPKLEGSVNIDGKSFLMYDDGPYTFRNSHYAIAPFSLDAEVYSKAYNFLLEKEYKKTWADGSVELLGRREFYAFPNFTDFKASHNDEKYSFQAEWNADPRELFWKCSPGIVLYNIHNGETQVQLSDYDVEIGGIGAMDEHFQMIASTSKLRAGKYKAAPALMVSGTEYPVKSMAQEITIPLKAKLDTNKVVLPAKGGSKTVHVETNGVVKQPVSSNEKVKVSLVDSNTVAISVKDTNMTFDEIQYQPISIPVVSEDEEDGTSLVVNVEQTCNPADIFKYIANLPGGPFAVFELHDYEGVPCTITETEAEYIVSGSYSGTRTIDFMGGMLTTPTGMTIEVDCADVAMTKKGTETTNWSFSLTIDKETHAVSGHTSSTVTDNWSNFTCLGTVSYYLHQTNTCDFEGTIPGTFIEYTVTSGNWNLTGNSSFPIGDGAYGHSSGSDSGNNSGAEGMIFFH